MTTLFAGIDLGGTTISGLMADVDGEIVWDETIATKAGEGPPAVLERIAALVEKMSAETRVRPSAVGIGCPGLVDIERGVTKFFPNLRTQWRDVPAAEILSSRLGCPVYLLNDVRAATLGELTFGHGKNVATMAFFSIGTGVGGGLVIDGRLRLGPLGAAGELGHQTIVADGPLCGCGNRGCLEALASGPAITAEAVRLMLIGQSPCLSALSGGHASSVTMQLIATAAANGDVGANAAIERAAEYIGIAAANVVTCLHPQLIVIGGGVAEIGEPMLAPIRRVIRERVRMFPPDDVRVERSLLGPLAGALGAAALALRGPNNL